MHTTLLSARSCRRARSALAAVVATEPPGSGDQVACELRDDYSAEGVDRTDHIAGFFRVETGLTTAAKIYREGSAEI